MERTGNTLSTNNKITYLVEVIYQQPYNKENELDVKVAVATYAFEGGNKGDVKRDAERYFDQVIRYGLKINGGSVLKSVILPSAILQVGLIDPSIKDDLVEPIGLPSSSDMDGLNNPNE